MFSGLDRCWTFTRILCKILFCRICRGLITQWMRSLNSHAGDNRVGLDLTSSNERKSWKLYFSAANSHLIKLILECVCFLYVQRSQKTVCRWMPLWFINYNTGDVRHFDGWKALQSDRVWVDTAAKSNRWQRRGSSRIVVGDLICKSHYFIC